ncbi:A24 family peptidase [Amnibacterium sp.]|uniref:prepilin peptidase n=1 Tax=Amnibacterium sp. TaxID=1872496 RepID=UPI00260224B3|nr:A24 family peptidase [Amnibacterium sp.]MCU1474307.1 prepilin peptidase [Amnibacterium sp.]
MTPVLILAVGMFGLLIGSFLNVVAYRVPIGMSVVAPPSACPGCGTPISARDNVPLLSWALLRGACRHCRMPISVRYPLVEAATGIVFAVAALPFLPRLTAATDPRIALAGGLELVAYLYLAAISVALAVIDLDVRRLPDAIVLPSYVVAVALLVAVDLLRGDAAKLPLVVLGGAGSFLFYYLLRVLKPGGMGLGDVKLAGVLGLYLGQAGLAQLLVGTFAAFVLGGVAGVALIVARRSTRKSTIPFGPWMLGGAWIGILAGAPLGDAYLRLVGVA